jgi:hypothetical protein
MKEDVDHLTEPLIGRIQAKAGYAEQTTGNHRPDGPGTGHALTFILDHLNRADQINNSVSLRISSNP